MAKGFAVADVAMKITYFSETVAVFIFVSMILLTGFHP